MSRKIGLSLSGGGYRAAAFHLGTLKKLNDLHILDKVDVLSTISGGSITGAAWCLHEGDYESFHQQMKETLATKNVITRIFRSYYFIRTALFVLALLGGSIYLSFTSYSWLVFPVLALFFVLLFKYQYQIFPVSKAIEKAYDAFFFHGKTLKDFKTGRPTMAIGSSNLHSGRPFTFSQAKMADSTYTYEYTPPIKFKQELFPVSRAVMASSCVPFAFSPVFIDKEFYQDPNDFKRIKPTLVDGGVYDNQGIQKLTQTGSSYECSNIITSDAGGNFIADKKYPNAISLLLRTVNLFMYRIKTAQMQQNLYKNVQGAAKPVAYFSLGWKLDNIISGFVNNMISGTILSSVISAHNFEPAWLENPKNYRTEIENHLKQITGYDAIKARDLNEEQWKIARSVGTNLTALKKEQIDCLIQQAENLTEIQVKLYCPALLHTPVTMNN